MSSQVVVGVDIGDESIRAVEVTGIGKPRPTVVRYQEIALPEGAVKSGEVTEVNTVSSALRQLWSAGGFRSKDVVLGVGNPKVLVRDLTVPRLSAKEIHEALPTYVQDMLPVPVEDALLDFYPISESVAENGPVVHGLLVAAVKDSVQAKVKAVQQAGLSPVAVDLIPFALCRLHMNSSAQGTIAFVDVGAHITNVVITMGGVPQFVRLIAMGGQTLTRALVDRLEINADQAETLKRSLGLVARPTDAAQAAAVEVIHDVTGDLLNSLRNTLSYYANTHQAVPFEEIVLTGGGAQLSGFGDALAEITRSPVTAADPFASVELSKDLVKDGVPQQRPMAVALALALGRAA